MKKVALCVVILALSATISSAATMRFDSYGFESGAGYTLGSINGQQGWSVVTKGAGSAEIVCGQSGQILKLTAAGSVADSTSPTGFLTDDAIVIHPTDPGPMKCAKVSFDVWRAPGETNIAQTNYANTGFNDLYWWSQDSANNYGVQWSMDGNTYPFGWSLDAASATTVVGEFANVTLVYDFENNLRSSWYNGNKVDENIVLDEYNALNTLSDIELYYVYSSPLGTAGTYGQVAYIDNLYVEWEPATVPEPGSMLALCAGMLGLLPILRHKQK